MVEAPPIDPNTGVALVTIKSYSVLLRVPYYKKPLFISSTFGYQDPASTMSWLFESIGILQFMLGRETTTDSHYYPAK